LQECVLRLCGDAGVAVWGGATLKMIDSTISESQGVGITASGTGTVATIEQCKVKNNKGEAGVKASHRGTVDIKYSVIEGNKCSGIAASNKGTTVTAANCEVVDQYGEALEGSSLSTTAGVKVFDGASARISRCTINQNHCAGVCAAGASTSVVVTDNTELMYNDKGVWGFDGAFVEAGGIQCRNNREAQISVS